MSDSLEVKQDRLYTKDHEWLLVQDDEDFEIGITAYAVDQLGDVTLVNLDVKVGDTVAAGKSFGTIESVKTLSDLYAPIAGKVVRINKELESKPELVNDDCWGKGWMIAIDPEDPADTAKLMEPEGYEKLLATL